MRKRFFSGLILALLVVLMSCGACFADLLSALPEPAGENPYSKIAVRFTDASKLIEGLYPSNFIEAIAPLAARSEIEDFIKFSNVIKALSESNLREFASLLVLDEDLDFYNGGVIMSVPGGRKRLDDAAASGKLTLFDLVSSLGEPVLEAWKAVDDSFEDFEFERSSDGVFFYKNNYVYIQGDKIIVFATKESTLSAAEAVNSVETAARLNHPNVLLVSVPKEMAETTEDIKAEIGFAYEDSTCRIKILSNVFRLMPGGINVSGEELENALRVIETVPMVGKGDPFFTSGGNTFLEGLDEIEERLMEAGDMEITLGWAAFLQAVQQIGISKENLGNLLAGSMAMVFGLDSEFLGIPLPLGGYLAITGKEGAAANVIGVVSEVLAQTGIATESKVDGWDKVYSVTFDPGMPKAVIAQRGESILAGIMNPEDLKTDLDINQVGVPSEKMLGWLVLDTEKIWKAARNAYTPISAMIMSGMFGSVSDEEREAVRFAGELLKTEFPQKTFKSWMASAEELDLHILMNPSHKGDFWKTLFELVVKLME